MKIDKTPEGLQAAYLDYVNNYLSVMKFAADYGISEGVATATIKQGRILHEAYADWLNCVKAGESTPATVWTNKGHSRRSGMRRL